jgi:fructose-1,6-bisphosphatase/inositol monophosphatase family enzyme
MPDFDLSKIIELTHEAGNIALEHFGKVTAERKADRSLVTDADREIERVVRRGLKAITPDYGFLGEESGSGKGGSDQSPCWVLDPLDGTGAFVSGLPTWAFSLGLVAEGEPVWGLVNLPIMKEMYYTGTDGRVYRNGEYYPAQPAESIESQSVLYVTASDSHQRYEITFPGKIRTLGSAAYHGLLSARPFTAGIFHDRVYLWDLAAVLALNAAWGIKVATLDGSPASPSIWDDKYALRQALLFSAPALFDRLVATIRRKPGV